MSAHAAFALISSAVHAAQADARPRLQRLPPRHGRSRRVAAGGIVLDHEIHGSGRPLVVVHGGLANPGSLAAVIPSALAASRQVIAVEVCGRSGDLDRPLRHDSLADEVAALLRHLGLGAVDIAGVCLGGSVALQVAIRHPGAVRSLVVASAPFRSDGWLPAARAEMAALDGGASQLLDEHYDWSAGIEALRIPVLILVGDGDRVRISHAVEMFERLGGGDPSGAAPRSQLVVLPGTAGGDALARVDLVARVVPAFLDAPLPASATRRTA